MNPKYATKDELHALDKEVATFSARVDGRFDTLSAKIDSKFDTMSEHIDAKFSALESRQTKWLIATAVAIIDLVVKLGQTSLTSGPQFVKQKRLPSIPQTRWENRREFAYQYSRESDN
ncbi:hypothetical protein FMM01_06955 [Schleiferilactobacillus harbinensis]|uniref:hypothetical protein n=1 Tax=Schleiferilactobacillus harbinensis TaxID=304207 RepID=UPI00123BCC6F|nr:hypothetical protein [Schleiferilactobacillus harbinensis]QEU47047.1 hypothetical protein FMM01_06955 [Schleiferilactobacillus harbinensis]